LLRNLDQLASDFPRHSTSASSQIQLARTRATSMRDSMRAKTLEMQVRATAIDRIMNAESLGVFADSLARFADDVPNSPMANEFDQVAGERELWEKGLRSNKVLQLLSVAFVDGVLPEEATRILQTYEEVSSNVVLNPIFDSFPDIERRLKEVESRESNLNKFSQQLALLTFAELVMVEGPDPDDPSVDNRYFLYFSHYDRFRDRFESKGRVGIEVVANESAAVTNVGIIGPITIIPEPRATVRWLLNRTEDSKHEFLSDWDGAFLRTAAELRKRPRLDAAIKEKLLLQLLKGGAEGSEHLRKRMADSLKLLSRRSEQRRRWFVPRPLSDSLDGTIEELVVPQMSTAYATRNSEWQQFRKASQQPYSWFGFLLRHENGRIVTQVKVKPTMSGSLYVIRPAVSDPAKIDFAKIGNWVDDHVVLGSTQRDLVAGRPVFFLPSATGT